MGFRISAPVKLSARDLRTAELGVGFPSTFLALTHPLNKHEESFFGCVFCPLASFTSCFLEILSKKWSVLLPGSGFCFSPFSPEVLTKLLFNLYSFRSLGWRGLTHRSCHMIFKHTLLAGHLKELFCALADCVRKKHAPSTLSPDSL